MDDRRTKRALRSRAAERSEDEKSTRPGAGPVSGGGGIFKSAAVAVLRQHRKLMTTGDITRLAVEMGLLKCQGKTPEATMASALYTDVKRKLQKSLFTRPQEGLFGLREWLDEGYYPEGWVGPPDGLGLAPFKRRNTTGAQQAGAAAPVSTAKAGRQGVRTGPGRSSKSRASRSWRTASSDAEDEDILEDDDDDVVLTGRSYMGASYSAAAHGGAAGDGGAMGGNGEDEDVEEAMGEGEEVDVEEEADGGEDGMAEDGPEEPGSGRRAGDEELAGAPGAPEEQRHHARDGGTARGHAAQQPSPGPGGSRRGGGRFRSSGGTSAGGASEAGVPQDECLSPLHMLGEAAASESVGELVAEQHSTPPAKRKRPSSITVPDRGGGLGGVEGITPKSPYEDSLAALHEIATSPSTFELTSHREAQQRDREAARSGLQTAGDGAAGSSGGGGGGNGGGGKVGRARPRLHVDVPAHGPDLVGGPGSRRDSGTPGAALLTDNPMLPVGPLTRAQLGWLTVTHAGQGVLSAGGWRYSCAPVVASTSTSTWTSSPGRGQVSKVPAVQAGLPGCPPEEPAWCPVADVPGSGSVAAAQGETTPAILLQASPVTTANGQQAMMLRQAPVLVMLPPALASPSAAAAGQLDTPALLHVQLPGGGPSELMQTTLITPTGQQLTPLRSHTGGGPQAGRGGLKVESGPSSSRPVGRRVSFSGQVGILGPPAGGGAPLLQPLQPPAQQLSGTVHGGQAQGGAPAAAATWPPRLTAAQVEHELTEITRVQAVVERLESRLGLTHPQVGKAWLSLARMYQHLAEAQRNNGASCVSSLAKSVEALKRARTVCRAVAESCGTTLQSEAAFDYLADRDSESAPDPESAAEPAASPADGARPAADRASTSPSRSVEGGEEHDCAAGTLGAVHASTVAENGRADGSGGGSAQPLQEQEHPQDGDVGMAGPGDRRGEADAGPAQPGGAADG